MKANVEHGEQNCYTQYMRENIMELIHGQHPSIVRSKIKSRNDVWWQGLDKGIENINGEYEVCYVYSYKREDNNFSSDGGRY